MYKEWLDAQINIDNYQELSDILFRTEFVWTIPMDENRYFDGLTLRYLYELQTGLDTEINAPCSLYEVMVSLCLKMEEIMYDEDNDSSARTWFKRMLISSGLESETNDKLDEDRVQEIITRILTREYSEDGYGGLFYIDGFEGDLRDIELWYQACFFMDIYI